MSKWQLRPPFPGLPGRKSVGKSDDLMTDDSSRQLFACNVSTQDVLCGFVGK
jgi:hypothetical protein